MLARPRAVILSGGFAGLERVFTLRQWLGDWIQIDLVTDRDDFLFSPNRIHLPFGGRDEPLRIRLVKPLRRGDNRLVTGTVRHVCFRGA